MVFSIHSILARKFSSSAKSISRNLKKLLSFFFSNTLKQGFGFFSKCDALRDLVPFIQFKKREKYPCKSVNFSKVAG